MITIGGTRQLSALYKGTNPVKAVYRGGELVWKKSRLPDGYQEVESVLFTRINNSAGTRVDTEHLITSEKIRLEMFFTMVTGGGRIAFSNVKAKSTTPYGIVMYGGYVGVGEFYGSVLNRLPISQPVAFETDGSNWTYSIAGYTITRQYSGTILSESSLCIGCETTNETTHAHTNEGPYGSIVLYEDGIKSIEMIPCRRISDDTYGFYDLCGNICSLTDTPFFVSTNSRYPIYSNN